MSELVWKVCPGNIGPNKKFAVKSGIMAFSIF